MSTSSCFHKVVSGESDGALASLTRGLFRALSVPYAAASSLIEIARTGQTAVRVDTPVISVGNITVGGTGKTPLVARVVHDLIARNQHPVILSRGYAADESGTNDEEKVLTRAFPHVLHLQDRNRARLARYASDARLGDVIVLDDGFQYHALHRDLNVCAIDATNPFGYDAVLPRGLLREPLAGLYRARPVVITRAELVTKDEIAAIRARVLTYNQYAKIVVSEMHFTSVVQVADGAIAHDGPAASSLSGKNVVIGSGIGNPAAFRMGVARLGARVRAAVEHGDHHAFTQADATALAQTAATQSADAVVVTVKDAVKLARLAWPAGAPPLCALDVEARITEGADIWDELLDEVVAGR